MHSTHSANKTVTKRNWNEIFLSKVCAAKFKTFFPNVTKQSSNFEQAKGILTVEKPKNLVK